MSFRLTNYYIARPGEPLPPADESLLYDIVYAGNGTFARSRKPGLEACIPVALYEVSGLDPVMPYIQSGYPKVPAHFLGNVIDISRAICAAQLTEALFHLSYGPEHAADCIAPDACSNGWHFEFPQQEASRNNVRPLHTGAGTSTERAVIELHSHHVEAACFSDDDDTDESQGFRLYGVIGTIFDQPALRVRVGMFGYFLEYPASEFFEMPKEITDCVAIDMVNAGELAYAR